MHNGGSFRYLCNNRTAGHSVSGLYTQLRLPFPVSIQRIHREASVDIFTGFFLNFGKGALNTIKDIGHDAGCQGNRKCCARRIQQLSRL